MRRAAAFIIAALMLASGILAAPATKPAVKPAASPPTTAPARMTPEQVTAFDGHFLGAKWEDVAAALKATGAVADGPKLIVPGGKGKFSRSIYAAHMDYPFEYGTYSFTVDNAGLVYKYQLTPAQWPAPPGSDAYDPRDVEHNKLKPGNKWWLVKSVVYQRADQGGATFELRQGRNPDEVAKRAVVEYQDSRRRLYKSMKQEVPEWALKIEDVEVREWFTPLIQKHQDERTD
jgi:hypothetical protein